MSVEVQTVWLEDAQGRRWPVAQTCALGRSTSNDIVIDDGKVSRRHALVHKQDDAEYWVIDLGSGNGTYLNGRRVTQPTRLGDADVLMVGDQPLTFHRISARATPTARSQVSAQTIINVRSIDCWLLVADIKGSSALAAQLSPTELAMTVGRWMGTCKELVDTHGGAINKFLGDGFFAYWLAETTGPTQILAALKALRNVQSDTSGPRFRLVLHRGLVSFGGGGSLGEDSLSGIDVVIAFRMEKIAGALGCDVMVTDEVREQLQGGISFRDLGTHPIPGLARAARRFHAVT